MTAFLGAMASITVERKSMAVAFSFLAGWTIGWGEVIAAIIVQYGVADEDLGVAFCKCRSDLGQIAGSNKFQP